MRVYQTNPNERVLVLYAERATHNTQQSLLCEWLCQHSLRKCVCTYFCSARVLCRAVHYVHTPVDISTPFAQRTLYALYSIMYWVDRVQRAQLIACQNAAAADDDDERGVMCSPLTTHTHKYTHEYTTCYANVASRRGNNAPQSLPARSDDTFLCCATIFRFHIARVRCDVRFGICRC